MRFLPCFRLQIFVGKQSRYFIRKFAMVFWVFQKSAFAVLRNLRTPGASSFHAFKMRKTFSLTRFTCTLAIVLTSLLIKLVFKTLKTPL